MENKNSKLKNFIQKDKVEEKPENSREINENDGLLERIDKKFVDKDGKMLLKEQLHEPNN